MPPSVAHEDNAAGAHSAFSFAPRAQSTGIDVVGVRDSSATDKAFMSAAAMIASRAGAAQDGVIKSGEAAVRSRASRIGSAWSTFSDDAWRLIHTWSVPFYLALWVCCFPFPAMFRLLSNLLVNTALRLLMLWVMQYVNFDDEISGGQRIDKRAIQPAQADREANYDLHMHLSIAFIATLHYLFPQVREMPTFTASSFAVGLLIHVFLSEPIYYAFHRLLHVPWFYRHFHSFHHASVVTEPATGTVQDALEMACYLLVFSLPLTLPIVLGGNVSMAFIQVYLIVFDFCNAVGHCNFEWSPAFMARKPWCYFFYTPTFHHLHHSKYKTNYSLFMPIWDKLFGTHWDEDEVTKAMAATQTQERQAPATVFLVHAAGLDTLMYTPAISQRNSMSKVNSMSSRLAAWSRSLVGIPCYLLMALTHRTGHFHISDYTLRDGRRAHYWSLDALGFQYFVPQCQRGIARRIEKAVADADRQGVEVMGLGALNKAEFINRGGEDILKRVPLSKTRLIHGDTLTSAAVIARLQMLRSAGAPEAERFEQVVVTGATSKIARACCLYLAQEGIVTHMVTPSRARFAAIQGEALGRYGAAAAASLRFHASLDTVRTEGRVAWLVLKMDLLGELPPLWQHRAGDVILDVVVPPSQLDAQVHAAHSVYRPASLAFSAALLRDHSFRCHYLEAGEMFACHAEVLVHYFHSKKHHDVGPVDIARLQEVWQQAMQLGFTMTGRRAHADAQGE